MSTWTASRVSVICDILVSEPSVVIVRTPLIIYVDIQLVRRMLETLVLCRFGRNVPNEAIADKGRTPSAWRRSSLPLQCLSELFVRLAQLGSLTLPGGDGVLGRCDGHFGPIRDSKTFGGCRRSVRQGRSIRRSHDSL